MTPSYFFEKVHDQFISKLHDSFVEKYGIEVTNIRIESFKIVNQELATSMSKQALTTAQTETQLANLTGQNAIATAQQQRDAEVARIKAEGEAIKLKTETEAKNKAILDIAQAEANSMLIKAKAESESIQLKADAEAKAIILKAEAEAKRADLLSKTPLGSQLATFQLYSDMVQKSLNGVEKVIYLPSDGVNNPLCFLNMAQAGPASFGLVKPK